MISQLSQSSTIISVFGLFFKDRVSVKKLFWNWGKYLTSIPGFLNKGIELSL